MLIECSPVTRPPSLAGDLSGVSGLLKAADECGLNRAGDGGNMVVQLGSRGPTLGLQRRTGGHVPKSAQRVGIVGNQARSLLNFRSHLVQSLVERGSEVYAFAPDFDAATRLAVTRLGARPVDYPLCRTSANPAGALWSILALAKLFRTHRLDAVFLYFLKPVIFGSLAARLARVPRAVSMIAGFGYALVQSNDRRRGCYRSILRNLVLAAYRYALRGNAVVVFQNPDDAAEFESLRIVTPAQMARVNGSGVDTEAFAMTKPVVSPVSFVFVGRLLEEKGVRELVQASGTLRQRGLGATVTLVGDIDQNPGSLKRSTVEEWVRRGDVKWAGPVNDVRPWLRAASVFILPSYREGTPRSALEALAIGRPIITTDVPGCREVVVDGHNGFMVPPRDSEALANAMAKFVCNPALIEPMGAKSRAIAEARYKIAGVSNTLCGFLEGRVQAVAAMDGETILRLGHVRTT